MNEKKPKRRALTTIQLLCIVGIVLLAFIFAWFVYIVLDVKYANHVIQTGETRIAVIDGYTTRGNHTTFIFRRILTLTKTAWNITADYRGVGKIPNGK